MDKPADMFDRDFEWGALGRFVTDTQPDATLGVVSGRRRQGKTYLLRAACQATGGFYFGATESTDAESLRLIGSALTQYLNAPLPVQPTDWFQVVDALLLLGREQPLPVVIDEFPYLAKANPALPSIIQQALAPLRRERTSSRTRLLLCGSAMSFMGKLLAGAAPLRGRAGLELVVRPLDHIQAAKFWRVEDPQLAFRLNAVVGGTPAYRREFVRDDAPKDMADFDDWVIRTVLNPESPLFREARYLLADETDIRDLGLYHAVLAAVAQGNTTRGGIASYIGRPAADISHPLNVLEDAGFLAHEDDMFRGNRTYYRIAEPLITFYYSVMRPVWSRLEAPGSAGRVWPTRQRQFSANALGPRFEQICREWALLHADSETFAELPVKVGGGVINDSANKIGREVDVVVVGAADTGKPPLLSLGECKLQEVMGIGHLERLRNIRKLVVEAGHYDTTSTGLACYSGAGFTDELRQAAAESGDVLLIGLDDIYRQI
ncbi:ATP-binding protein [Nocardia sp. NEAU-G5]|uniref:ATP-binding protein n=1 Tax=Nocardia albiluteola TaxID=2842303 RepID=A0ABS6AWZ4_9NOCA|nr:ATP-binding protein [Nocardia albiluteola]MBU3062586.1 ATP-binding protein [Nocardia albiluteola]MBU3065580.1 ATP-binding protein [Nocardia albiluteola]